MEQLERWLKQALVKMHVYERDHNRIAYIHTKEILQLIFENAPIDEKDLKSMLRISASIDKRYITQYLDGFRVWGVIFRENGVIYVDNPKNFPIEEKEQIRQDEIISNTNEGQNNDETGTGRNRIISKGKSPIL